MKKRVGIIILMIITILTLISCSNNISKKAMEQGKLALANKEYDKALASFQLAKDEGSKNEEVPIVIEIIESYLNCKILFNERRLDEAKDVIANVSDYDNYSIKEDIDIIKDQIDEEIKKDESIINDINSLIVLVDEKKYDESKATIIELNKKVLSEEVKIKVDDIGKRIDAELQIIESERLAEENRLIEEEKIKKLEQYNKPIELSEVIEYVSNYARDGERIVSVLGNGEIKKGHDIYSSFNIPSTEKNDDFYTVLTDYGQKIEDGFVVNIRNKNLYNSYGEKVN